MAEKDLEAEDIEQKVHDLAAAMKRVKSAQADRDDVVVELRHAKFSRLELLSEDLVPVFEKLPKEIEMFDVSLTTGEVPRLWIDMTSFVRMGKDGRTYEFVKDTRLGRTILGSTENREKIGTHVTDYVAERVLERERMIEGDWISASSTIESQSSNSAEQASKTSDTNETSKVVKSRKSLSLMSTLIWFFLGLSIGLCALMFVMAFDLFEPLRAWISGTTR